MFSFFSWFVNIRYCYKGDIIQHSIMLKHRFKNLVRTKVSEECLTNLKNKHSKSAGLTLCGRQRVPILRAKAESTEIPRAEYA